MLSEWEIKQNYIFGYNANIINLNEIKSVYMFDLDYTLIKTKSGKKFPTSKTDWELLDANVLNKLSSLKKSLIGIISNQKGLKTPEQKTDWIDKIKRLNQIVGIDFVFASTSDDRYRKPLPGSFEFVREKIVGVNWDNLIDCDKIYYIGDAFGREKDFSDTDIKYALNNKFKFKTPEIFFKFNKEYGKSGSVDYPNITYFTELEQTKLFNDLDSIINSHKKIIIITIGLPASGKSFLRKELIKKYPQFAYSNNDDINSNVQSKNLIKKISTDYDFIIDDNTNLDKSATNAKLKQFESYYKVGIWFNYDMDICFHLNWMRMYWYGAKLLPKVSYYTLKKKFDSDSIKNGDGFDKFISINKVFREMDLSNKIKYYF
jgi:bifunctional polynucleotide phosphatase/kinase